MDFGVILMDLGVIFDRFSDQLLKRIWDAVGKCFTTFPRVFLCCLDVFSCFIGFCQSILKLS